MKSLLGSALIEQKEFSRLDSLFGYKANSSNGFRLKLVVSYEIDEYRFRHIICAV